MVRKRIENIVQFRAYIVNTILGHYVMQSFSELGKFMDLINIYSYNSSLIQRVGSRRIAIARRRSSDQTRRDHFNYA